MTTAPDDLELLERCARGENAAWTLFLERYGDFIAYMIRRAAPQLSQNEVQELHDEIIAWFFERDGRVLKTYRGESKVTSWIGVVVTRRVKRRIRQRIQKTLGLVSLDALTVDAATDLAADARRDRGGFRPEAIDALREALGALPERDRILLEGAFLHKRSYEELAEELGVKEGSIGQLLFRAKGKLKKKLGGEKFLDSLSGLLVALLSSLVSYGFS